jgi:two-component system phosphate regulon sensor histidine kinase PhoR
MGRALGRRVTLVAPDGRVVGDSEFDDAELAQLQNHAARPEVAEALAGRIGTARRPSPSTREWRTYVAIPVDGLGVARVSLPTASLDAVMDDARRDLLAAALVALLIALAIAWGFSRSVTRPIVELRNVAKALAAGDLARRPTLGAPAEVGELAVALRELADQL